MVVLVTPFLRTPPATFSSSSSSSSRQFFRFEAFSSLHGPSHSYSSFQHNNPEGNPDLPLPPRLLHHRAVVKEQQKALLRALLLQTLQKIEEKESRELIIQRFKGLNSSHEGTNHGDGEPSEEDTSLTPLRPLKVLDVHEYVHSSLQTSYLRGLVQNRRTVDEL